MSESGVSPSLSHTTLPHLPPWRHSSKSALLLPSISSSSSRWCLSSCVFPVVSSGGRPTCYRDAGIPRPTWWDKIRRSRSDETCPSEDDDDGFRCVLPGLPPCCLSCAGGIVLLVRINSSRAEYGTRYERFPTRTARNLLSRI